MEAGEKDAISHRARAAAALREQLAAALQEPGP
jgi:inosine/xanthosine triphosphate pyrophosphatase family protein